MSFLKTLKNQIRQFQISGQSLLVAVSGGADSVALLHGLCNLNDELDINIHAAHFNHQIRGESAEEDARWVAALCQRFGIPCFIGTPDSNAKPIGSEEDARDRRYQFLVETAENVQAAWIAFAHHADDQAETILHHILRGTGVAGLRGIPETRQLSDSVALIRPFLKVRRAEILDYLQEVNQDFRADHTNADSRYTRNRIRNELLPKLRDSFNPQIESVLLRLSEQAIEYQGLVDTMVNGIESKVFVDRQKEICRVDVETLGSQPPLVIRSCFVRLWTLQNWPRQSMGSQEWSALADSLQSKKSFTLPGSIDVSFRGSLMILEVRS